MLLRIVSLFITAVTLQVARSDPSCLSPTGQSVDWFITLKINNGDAYAYCDSVICNNIAASGQFINDSANSPIQWTLSQIQSGPNLPADQGYLLWNDQPPNNLTATTTNAHAKGFIGLGKTSGFLLVHSVPEFPAFTDSTLSQILLHVDDSQQIYGQHFICTTTSVINLEKIACGYNIDNPKVYGSKLPSTMTSTTNPCLTQMVSNKRNTKTMSLVIPYQTLGGVSFTKFSKSKDNNIPLYEQVVCPELKTGLLVESWGRPYEDATCTGPYSVVSNTRVQIDGVPLFKDTQDHSKYGISTDNKIPYVCLGDINRMKSQWTRGGGTICLKDSKIHKLFAKMMTCSGCISNTGYSDLNNSCDSSCQNCSVAQCDSTCASCSIPQDPNSCTSCQYGYYLSNSQCLPCKSPCADCIVSESVCTDCIDNYTLQNVIQCIPVCDPSCSTCSSPLNPNACLSCPSGSYLKENTCLQCISPCNSCTLGDTNSCSSCIQDYTLVGTKCQPICDNSCLTCLSPNNSKACSSCSGNSYLNISTSECLSCDLSCTTCKDSPTNCTSCSINYKQNGNKCDPICDSSCLTCSKPVNSSFCLTCSNGYYLDTGKCIRCQAPCSNCVDNQNKCTSCINSYSLSGNICQYDSSPSASCHSSCNTCSKNQDPQACLSCFQNFYLSVTNTCQQCESPCLNCTVTAKNCLSCQTNYTLNGSTCIPNCDSSCKTCKNPVDSTSCMSCNQGYFLSSGKCLHCKAPCLECSNSETQCSSCIQNYNFNALTSNCTLSTCDNSCLTCSSSKNSSACTSCASTKFLNSNNQCVSCKSPCLECVDSESNCISCQSGYVLENSKCNVKTTNNITNNQFLKVTCHYSCSTCFGSEYYECLTCSANREIKISNAKKTQICACNDSTTDKQDPQCEDSSLQKNLLAANSGLLATSSVVTIISSVAISNPLMIISYADFAQTVSIFTYVNKNYAFNYDSHLNQMYYFHLNIPFKSLSKNSNQAQKRVLQTITTENSAQSHANPKIYLNDRHPEFITNALTLIIIISFFWIVSMLCSKISIQTKHSLKAQIKHFFYQAFPLVLFIFTVQELSVLIFFQFQQMTFSTALESFSSIMSIAVLLYIIIICCYLYSSIEQLNQRKYLRLNSSENIASFQNNISKILPFNSMVIQQEPTKIQRNINTQMNNSYDYSDLEDRFFFFTKVFKQEYAITRHFGLVIVCRKIITGLVSSFCYEDPLAQSIILCCSYAIYFILTIAFRPFKNLRYTIFIGIIESILLLMHISLIIIISGDDGSNTQLLFTMVHMIAILVIMSFYIILAVYILFRLFLNCTNKRNRQQPVTRQVAISSKSQLDELDQSNNSPNKKQIYTINQFSPSKIEQRDCLDLQVHQLDQFENSEKHNYQADLTAKGLKQSDQGNNNSFTIVSHLPSQVIKLSDHPSSNKKNNLMQRMNVQSRQHGKIVVDNDDGYIHQIEYNNHHISQLISNINRKN